MAKLFGGGTSPTARKRMRTEQLRGRLVARRATPRMTARRSGRS